MKLQATLGLLMAVVLVTVVMLTPCVAAEPLRIAMVLWRGETSAESGFKHRLEQLGYEVEYTTFDADQDRSTLRSLLDEKLVPRLESFDYVYTFGTTASKMAKTLIGDRVPQLFNIVADPVKAGIVAGLDDTGANINGASNMVPLSAQIRAAGKLFAIKRLGFFFNPREENARIQRNEIYELAQKIGFEVVDLRSPPAMDSLQENLQKLGDGSIAVDAVYLPLDSYLISQSKVIGEGLRKAKIKSIGSMRQFVTDGALLGMVPDYAALGAAVADLLHRNLQGEELRRLPVQQIYASRDPVLVVNETTMTELAVDIPPAVLGRAIMVK